MFKADKKSKDQFFYILDTYLNYIKMLWYQISKEIKNWFS